MAGAQNFRSFGPNPSEPVALEMSSLERVKKTSSSDTSIKFIVASGEEMEFNGGIEKELRVKTEWKYVLNRVAFSKSEEADSESENIHGGMELCLVIYLIYL